MTNIATLNPANNASTGTAHAIASIPLSKLVPWDGNVRKTGAAAGLAELTASIAAHGVLQSLVVRKTSRGKYAIVAGRRRFLALSALAEGGSIEPDAPVPCRIVAGSADATEISLTENVVRAPMHPADQFEAFRALINAGASVADVAARFGIAEVAVAKRLQLGNVSTVVLNAYRQGELTLEQVQAFTVADNYAAQHRVLTDLRRLGEHPDDIRRALTEDAVPGTDRRARFVTIAAYEEAGGAVRRDLFAEGDEGVYLLDAALLNQLALGKLQALADALKAEGWSWVESAVRLDYDTRGKYRVCHAEPQPLSDEAAQEQKQLSAEYERLFDSSGEPDEETSERLDAIETRMQELEDSAPCVYSPETLRIAGAIVSIDPRGEPAVLRGLVRPDDEPLDEQGEAKPRPEFSAALVESLTEARTAGIGAMLAGNPDVALAAVVHALAGGVFPLCGGENSLQISARPMRLREASKGSEELERAHDQWSDRLPAGSDALWQWCLSQDQSTLLDLLAYCAARSVNAVQAKHDRPGCKRFAHANRLASALRFDMAQWFTPTAENYFSRVRRASIVAAIAEATAKPARRSWDKLKKPVLAVQAEREVAGTGWLPQPLRPAA